MTSVNDSEFPILCESCLGDNPFLKMSRDTYGAACKMCARPFTVFKWRPGRGEGYKRTEVCRSCAQAKNLCQTCILDMQFALPSQLRDAVLASVGEGQTEQSDVNENYALQQKMALIAAGNNPWEHGDAETPNEKLLKIARGVALDRAQPRVKVPLPQHPVEGTGASKRTFEQISEPSVSSDRGGDGGGSSATHPAAVSLPPGISSLEQLQTVVNLNRLPAAFALALKKQLTDKAENAAEATAAFETQRGGVTVTASNSSISSSSSSSDQKDAKSPDRTEIKVHKSKVKGSKFAPRPPSRPPPPSAYVKNA